MDGRSFQFLRHVSDKLVDMLQFFYCCCGSLTVYGYRSFAGGDGDCRFYVADCIVCSLIVQFVIV